MAKVSLINVKSEKVGESLNSNARMASMRRFASSLTVMTIDDVPRDAGVIPEPLFQSFDPARDSSNSSVWGYGGKGRPAALLSLSLSPSREGVPGGWMFELNSLSSLPVEAIVDP